MERDNRLTDEEGRLAALRRYEGRDEGGREPFQRMVELVQQIIGVPMAAISLLDTDTQWLRASRGFNFDHMPRKGSFADATVRQAEPLSVSDVAADGRFAEDQMVAGAPHIRSYLGAPLVTPDGYNIGALGAFDIAPHQFDERQAGIMTRLAEIVVEQLELQQIAKQDAMTGALTRRGFFAEVEREFLRATRYDRPSALIIIDVDRFRTINDRYGHAVGDAVLVSIANACMATMRKSDVFGRIGGEEFGLLLPETSGSEAADAAERIRAAVEATIVEVDGASVRATISLGIAPMPAAGEGAATWLAEADIALYEAKSFGRNRVVVGKARRPVTLATDPAHQKARPH